MKIEDLKKLGHEEETEQLRELFFSELDALMARYGFLTRRSPLNAPRHVADLPGDTVSEVDRLTMSWQIEWAATHAESYGMTREDFLTASASAFDIAVEDSAEEDEDIDANAAARESVSASMFPEEKKSGTTLKDDGSST